MMMVSWSELRHNPYFNRWFSAIHFKKLTIAEKQGHNPYFNRWFSAILSDLNINSSSGMSQSLF